MKSDRVVILMVFALFLLMLVTYTRFDLFQQRMTRQSISEMNGRFDTLIATMRSSYTQIQNYADTVTQLQERLAVVESEKKDLWAKVTGMAKDVETLRTALVAANMDTSKQIVELGAISVKKQSKAKK